MSKRPASYAALEDLGRTRLSPNFFMREFLYSEIAVWHGMRNIPDNPKRAVWAGRQLCTQLLEPLQATFGRVHVRSGYRSPEVNAYGNAHRLNCASNEKNHGKHIWDYPDANGHYGATACIVIPWLLDHVERGGSWTDMAWWIHDHLPYSSLYFFPNLLAFNINWHQAPVRRVDSYAPPKGCLIRPGTPAAPGLHAQHYPGFPPLQAGPAIQHAAPEPSPVHTDAASPIATTAAPGSQKSQEPRRAKNAHTRRAPSQASIGSGKVYYRAIHTKTKWRKAHGHKNLESAIRGRNGAAALFRGTVRINYDKHGQPLYALVWQEGDAAGSVIRANPQQRDGIQIASIPTARLMEFEDLGGVSDSVLEACFERPDSGFA